MQSHKARKKKKIIKHIQTEKGEIKGSLFAGDVILNIESPKVLLVTTEFNKVVEPKLDQRPAVHPPSRTEQSGIDEAAAFTAASKQ